MGVSAPSGSSLTARSHGAGHHGVVRVLVVEDEQLLADTIADGLRRQAMAVDVVYDGDAALDRLAVNDYDVVVLDYLTKPFAFAELVARIQALGRRARPAAPPVLERAGIRLDQHRRTVTRDGDPVRLSRKEFAVLAELLLAGGGVVSAEQLLEKAWDEHVHPFTGVVRFIIMTLRRKLGDPPIIDTVPGAGYRIP